MAGRRIRFSKRRPRRAHSRREKQSFSLRGGMMLWIQARIFRNARKVAFQLIVAVEREARVSSS